MTQTTLGTVLVTGGASGLGAAVARAVADAGGRPVILDRVRSDLDVEQEVVDLADLRAAESAVRSVAERVGGLDAVVTCAGTDACGRLDDVPGDDWDRVVVVNLLGTAAVVRAALPGLLERRGRVVTVASTLGLRALSDATAYCASKFGVVGFTRALAAETQGRMGVTLLVPGGMHTAFFDGRDPQYMPPPDAKLNQPADVAQAVVFALRQPPGCEVRELVVTPAVEGSWP
jgi:NAD(P)-dependent dehydrogenase (short-subunit alcohol dehydrogenase family)